MLQRSGIRIFKLFGIDIYIHSSWFLIFVLLAWSLAGGVFPHAHPEWPPLLNLCLGIIAALLFFFSVLLHELAHALVARSRNLPVRRITLFLFGGVSNIEREPASAKTEFLMAIVGPITSLGLGVILGAVGMFIAGVNSNMPNIYGAIERPGPLSTLFIWLGTINILVGIFNLIPGFPLDGGRVLRSAIWGASGDLHKATNIASFVGQLTGWIFIFSGLWMVFGGRVPFFGAGIFNGIWLAFIGWFLHDAASVSRTQMIIHDLLEDVPVKRLMRSDVPAVHPDVSVDDLVDNCLMKSNESAFPVLENDELVGLVCIRDIRKVPKNLWPATRVREIMTPVDRLTIVNPELDSAEALSRLTAKDVRQLPVVSNGHLLGILRRRDILRWLQLHTDHAAV